MRRHSFLPLLPLLSALFLPLPALAQSILPAADGTGTLVLPDGTTYTITGGTLSGDGANLFHSFEQFGLTANEVATFLTDPAVQNILGRVVGGNASLIDGLIQVNGGANLYLINPAGILFGPNTVLNLEGSFTATSASGVGFGEAWLNALGQSDYRALNGDPTAFSFAENAGAILNSGNLAVGTGEQLTLMGGSVVNLGTLEAPGGQIMVLAVPGENLVILRPVGALLGLEMAPLPLGAPGTTALSPLDIPGLLRAGEPEIATGLVANPDGSVSLVGSTIALPTASGTTITSGTLSVAGDQGGTVQVLGDRVAVVGATVDASGTQGGGQVLIGGEYQGQGTTPPANRTFVDADTTITANAGETGNGGEVILWAEEGTRFDGTITAQGGTTGGDGGFVEVSGRQSLAFNGLVDVSAPNGEMGTLLLDPTDIIISATISSPGVDASLPDILAGELPGSIIVNSAILASQTANVVLQATNNITIADGVALNFVPGGGSITFTADADGVGGATLS
jgi:filamentous hemagglutinin family protein